MTLTLTEVAVWPTERGYGSTATENGRAGRWDIHTNSSYARKHKNWFKMKYTKKPLVAVVRELTCLGKNDDYYLRP